jgi:hypothetical protein
MRHALFPLTGSLLATLAFGPPGLAHAQAAERSFSVWQPEATWAGRPSLHRSDWSLRPLVPAAAEPETRTHTLTGLLIGGLVGAAATTVFLVAFCGDPDTRCEADEVGRAALIIAVPAAAAGALIGSLIRTRR